MWKVTTAILLLVIALASSPIFTYAQERAFSSFPVYTLAFDSAATAPAGCEWQRGRDANLGLAYFNGINKLVNLSTTNDDNGRSFPVMGSSFTIEAWVAYESFNSYSHWFSIGNADGIDNIYIGNTGTGNTVRFGTVDTPFGNSTNRRESMIQSANSYSVGVFSHIVATSNLISLSDTSSDNAAVLNLYVNGAFVANATQRNPRTVVRTKQFLARSLWPSDGLFNGWLDSINIYNYALSDQAVFAHRFLRRVPFFELAFSEDPTQIAGSSATYSFLLADPSDVAANVSQWHQGVVVLASTSSQYMDLTTSSGSSTSGTTLPALGGVGYGTGLNNFQQGWSFEFTFKTPSINSGSKIFDAATSTGSDRIYLGFENSALNFYIQYGSTTASTTPVLTSVNTNTWYHIIVVVTPISITSGTATHSVYVNGVSTGNYSRSYPGSASRTVAYIGRSTVSTESYANLVFDLVRIYDYALPTETVANLYYSVSQPAPVVPIPPVTIYSTSPSNMYNFDVYNQSTGYSTYTFINETVDGHFGVAAFNGINSSVNLQYFTDSNGHYISPYIGGGSMTFCIWAKFSAIRFWSRLFDFGGVRGISNNNIILANRESTTTLAFQVYSGSSVTEVQVEQGIQPGKWSHYCAVVEQLSNNFTSALAANLSLYIDGVRRASSPGYIPPRVLRANYLVGRSNWNDARFIGYMDSISYFEYALDYQQIAAHACTSRPPVFEFAFVRDPRTINPNITYQFGWTQYEDEVIPANTPVLNPTNQPFTFTHDGLLTFNGSNQYVNLTATSGPTSLGTQLPVIGGVGSGIGRYQGWSFEILFKANTRATWSKIFDFGVNTNGDDDIILGFEDNSGNLGFEIWNSAVIVNNAPKNMRYIFINNLQVGKWYHVVIVVTPLSIESATAMWTTYVNGESNQGFFGGVYPRAIPRKNANVGKSNWNDNYFNGTIDSFRIYDYALNEDSVIALYRTTRSVAKPVLDAPFYHPGAMNTYSFQAGYDDGVSGVASYNWVASLDGHNGVASFDGTNRYVNLMGFTDSRGSSFPVVMGGTDLTFTGWVRYNAFLGYSRIFDISNGQGVQTLALMNIGTTAQLGLHIYSSYGTTAWDTNYNWPLNQWMHVAIVIKRNPQNAINATNAATYLIYINGTQVANNTGYYTSSATRLNNYLGRSGWSPDAYFNGAMDMFAWFDYALPEDSVKAHSKLINPPYFELTFTTDPRNATLATSFGYNWINRDPSDPANSKHQGILDLSPSLSQYVDLMKTRGSNSLGVFMPQVGGNTIGVDETAGWSFEIVVRFRNTSSAYNFCKVLDLGNGPEGGNGDDNIVFGLRPDGVFAFEVTNTRFDIHSIFTILPYTQPNVWYTIVVTVVQQDLETFRAGYTSYVNGVFNNSMQGQTDIQGIYRESAMIGKSEWASDPFCDVQVDVLRIYDYVLSSQEVAALSTLTVDAVVPIQSSSTGAAVPSSSAPGQPSSSASMPVVSSSSASTPVPSSSSATVVVPSSSTGATVAPVLNCKYTGGIPDGSVLASVIFAKPMNDFSSQFGPVFSSVVGGLCGLDETESQRRIACTHAYDGNGIIAQTEPIGTNTKVEFAFLNNGGSSASQLSSMFASNFTLLGERLTSRLGGNYNSVSNLETHPYDSSSSSGLSDGAIAGIVIGVVIGVVLLVALAYFLFRGRSQKSYGSKRTYETHSNDTHEDHVEQHEDETDEVEMQNV